MESCLIKKNFGVGFYIEHLRVPTRRTTEAKKTKKKTIKSVLSLTSCNTPPSPGVCPH